MSQYEADYLIEASVAEKLMERRSAWNLHSQSLPRRYNDATFYCGSLRNSATSAVLPGK